MLFAARLATAIDQGRARRIQQIREVYAPSEEWFIDTMNGEVYVCLTPDDRVLPEWVKVDVFEQQSATKADPKNINTSGLSAIPTGFLEAPRGESLRLMLKALVRASRVEVVELEKPRLIDSEKVSVSTFRDSITADLYEFIVYPDRERYCWQSVPGPSNPDSKLKPN